MIANSHKIVRIFTMALGLLLSFNSCKEEPKQEQKKETHTPPKPPQKQLPKAQFNADSAYAFIAEQVAFGPRVPNTEAHRKTANYLAQKLDGFTQLVIRQNTTVKTHTGAYWNITNIIGSFNPEAQNRIILCAHWDTRPKADEDPERPEEAADGADDGGSGTGVLLEVARQLKALNTPLGVDIILFDAEDGGGHGPGTENSWCLGSQYWAANPHKAGYEAEYAILLDMVGSKNAMFALEQHSMSAAPDLMRSLWKTGQRLGYGRYFTNLMGGSITDDHYYITKLAGIPAIDIINYNPMASTGFGEHWHTHKDNMEVIDKATLMAVGHTLMQWLAEETARLH